MGSRRPGRVVVVAGATQVYDRYFDLVRYPARHGVVPMDLERRFPGWLDGLPTDARKDQPVQGMVILRDIKQDALDKGLWVGGDILDPNDGKVYKVQLKPVDGGKKLDVRGYIGTPLLGRTQTWIRVE